MNPVAIFKALGQAQRYALFLDLLRSSGASCCEGVSPGETACCVLDLTDRHDLAQSTISHHLRILVDAGLVRQEKSSTYRIYRIDVKTWNDFLEHVSSLNARSSIGHCLPDTSLKD